MFDLVDRGDLGDLGVLGDLGECCDGCGACLGERITIGFGIEVFAFATIVFNVIICDLSGINERCLRCFGFGSVEGITVDEVPTFVTVIPGIAGMRGWTWNGSDEVEIV